MSSKLLTAMALDLLPDDALLAENILKKYNPVFKSKEGYFNFTENMFSKRLFLQVNINLIK
ncbi:MAG: hypothetical protein A2Y21_01940 [Clostridiales bacterium GWC2_40_7]|nr:MAG: hypothetical protein A2Y21_01940 [Clostridiales bacterium GWC2_40_7]